MGGKAVGPDGAPIQEMAVSEASPVVDAWTKVRAAFTSLLNYLNALGSILLAYALANPSAFYEVRDLLPVGVQPYAPLIALGWFALVQLAKMSAIKKAQQN